LEADTNKDGKLSMDEVPESFFEQKHGEVAQQILDAADHNSDGFFTTDEMPALFFPETHDGVLEIAAKQTLLRSDKDGDGQLSQAEMWEGQTIERSDTVVQGEQEEFKNMDIDGNGFLSVQELKHWESGAFYLEEELQQVIKIADANGDQHVSADELEKAKSDMLGLSASYEFAKWAHHDEL